MIICNFELNYLGREYTILFKEKGVFYQFPCWAKNRHDAIGKFYDAFPYPSGVEMLSIEPGHNFPKSDIREKLEMAKNEKSN